MSEMSECSVLKIGNARISEKWNVETHSYGDLWVATFSIACKLKSKNIGSVFHGGDWTVKVKKSKNFHELSFKALSSDRGSCIDEQKRMRKFHDVISELSEFHLLGRECAGRRAIEVRSPQLSKSRVF